MMTFSPLALSSAAARRPSSRVSPAMKRLAKPRRIPVRAIGPVKAFLVESQKTRSRIKGMELPPAARALEAAQGGVFVLEGFDHTEQAGHRKHGADARSQPQQLEVAAAIVQRNGVA